MKRTEVIAYLKEAYGEDAAWFQPETATHQYLLGYTISRKRGICLVWAADEDQVVTKDMVIAAYHEVVAAGLTRPFLLFGTSKRYNDQACIFLQLAFEGNYLQLPPRLWRGKKSEVQR